MSPASVAPAPLALRWLVILTSLFVCALLVLYTLGGSAADAVVLHTLGLMAIALAGVSWVLYPVAVSVVLSLAVAVCLAWAWGAHQLPPLNWDLLALVAVLGAAGWHRRRWARRRQRMAQLLDDLEEERTIKDQAIALARQTHEALRHKHDRYAQLQSIAEELSNMTDVQSIARLAVDRAFTLIGKSDVCLLFLVNHDGAQELSLFASKKRPALPSIQTKHGDQFDRYVMRSQRPLLVNDVRRDFRFTASTAQRPVSSVIACPLLLNQRAEGLVRLDSGSASAYTQDDLRFLDILLDLIATAVANAQLFAQTQQLAMTDGLTKLLLRRPFLEELARELARIGRSREPAAVLMVDVDHFKRYNDTFGHTAGDLVLKAVAEVLRSVVPPEGTSARYGGEEFAVLLPRTARDQAADVAEAIRKLVSQRGGGEGRKKSEHTVTVSIGVAAFPDDAQGDLELIRVADQRLYQAKNAGRNLVCAA